MTALSLRPVAERLAALSGGTGAVDGLLRRARRCSGRRTSLDPGDVLLLENLRFHPEEEANDREYAKALASLGEVYVNDAFGTAHRAHASTEGVARLLPAVAGFLMEKEIEFLGRAVDEPGAAVRGDHRRGED